MKIVYAVHQFFPNYCSGTESVTYQLANMAQMAGHRVAIAAYQPDRDIPNREKIGNIYCGRRMYKKISVTEFFHQHVPLDMDYAVVNDEMLEFARIYLKREKPDVVHVTHLMRVAPFIQAASELRIPCIVTLTDAMAICPRIVMQDRNGNICRECAKGERCANVCNELKDYPLRLQTIKELLSSAFLITAPSKYLAGTIGKELDLNIQVFPHGLDFTNMGTAVDLMPKSGNIQLGWFGTMNEHKGLNVLLKAMSKVEAPNIQLNLYGRGTPEYEAYLHSLCPNDLRIKWNGWKSKEEVYRIYNLLDAVVVSSVCNESFSLVKNEAISRGIPVIVSNLGALPENIEHGVDGFVFDPFAEDALVDILQSIGKTPSLIREMSSRVQDKIVISVEQEFFRYQAAYLDAIGY